MHPKIRELADTIQFSRRTVREAAGYLPEDDTTEGKAFNKNPEKIDTDS